MVNLEPSRPRPSSRQKCLVESASHESSVAHLGHMFDNFRGELLIGVGRFTQIGTTLMADGASADVVTGRLTQIGTCREDAPGFRTSV